MRAGYGGARNAFGKMTEAGWAAAGLPIETHSDSGSYAELEARLAKTPADVE